MNVEAVNNRKWTKNDELLDNYGNLDLKMLDPEIKKNGCVYKCVRRTERKCLYAQYQGDKIVGYEVFLNKIVPYRDNMARFRDDVEDVPEYKEAFPGNEEFGIRAWTYNDEKLANKMYDLLNKVVFVTQETSHAVEKR